MINTYVHTFKPLFQDIRNPHLQQHWLQRLHAQQVADEHQLHHQQARQLHGGREVLGQG